MRAQNKVVVVTGAASGMGKAIATRFAAEGAKIVAADIHAQRLNDTVKAIKDAGGTIFGVAGNIAQLADAEGLITTALERFDRLDVLINNAGIMDYMAGVGELTDEVYRRVFAVNVDGPVFATRRAVQQFLKQGGGNIVNISSFAGQHGGVAGVAYTMSKHALVGLTRNTAWFYAKKGIRCNAICPGGVNTNIQESMPREKLDPTGAVRGGEFAALAPSFGEPTDIASLALFLASDEARFVNGAIVAADGGWDAA